MRKAGLEEAQAGIIRFQITSTRLQGEISIILDMQMTLPLWQKTKKN